MEKVAQRHDTKLLAILETVGMLWCDTWKLWCLCFDRGSRMSSVQQKWIRLVRYGCWTSAATGVPERGPLLLFIVHLFFGWGDTSMAEVTLKGYDNSIVHEILQKSLNSCSNPWRHLWLWTLSSWFWSNSAGNLADFGHPFPVMLFFFVSHTIHGTGLLTHLYHTNPPNVGK